LANGPHTGLVRALMWKPGAGWRASFAPAWTAHGSASQRLILLAIEKEVSTAEQRFGLRDGKRTRGTDASGSKGERQDAPGALDAMMKVYDHPAPKAKPSGLTE